MSDPWDGKPRRKNDIYLQTIEAKVDQVFALLKGEFGDRGLNGEPIEGRTSEKIRHLIDRVQTQNGRISKLENWRWFVLGVCAVITLFLDIIFKH